MHIVFIGLSQFKVHNHLQTFQKTRLRNNFNHKHWALEGNKKGLYRPYGRYLVDLCLQSHLN